MAQDTQPWPTMLLSFVVEGNRIRSIGRLPEDVRVEDQDAVHVIDATGQWIMPGLIDGHCHLLFGFPQVGAVASARGTDSGNSPLMPYGQLHAHEPGILVRYGGYTPLEAIAACTRNNAFVVGLEHDVGVLEAGRLADIILLDSDPLADIRVLQGGQHLAMVIKDGRVVDLDGAEDTEPALAFAAPASA